MCVREKELVSFELLLRYLPSPLQITMMMRFIQLQTIFLNGLFPAKGKFNASLVDEVEEDLTNIRIRMWRRLCNKRAKWKKFV